MSRPDALQPQYVEVACSPHLGVEPESRAKAHLLRGLLPMYPWPALNQRSPSRSTAGTSEVSLGKAHAHARYVSLTFPGAWENLTRLFGSHDSQMPLSSLSACHCVPPSKPRLQGVGTCLHCLQHRTPSCKVRLLPGAAWTRTPVQRSGCCLKLCGRNMCLQ